MASRAPSSRRGLFALVALLWTVFVVYGSLVPLDYRPISVADAMARFQQLPPIGYGVGARADWGANILLFVPLTFLWMGALVADRPWVVRIVAGILLIPLSTALSSAIEFAQIWFPTRTLSRNDIVAETVGGAIGVLLWLVAGQLVVTALRASSTTRRPASRADVLLYLYLVGFILYSIVPLDLTISIADLYAKYRNDQVQLIPFFYRYDSWVNAIYQFFGDIMVFVPIGAWAVHTRRGASRFSSPVKAGLWTSAVIALCIEGVQLLVLSRYTDATDVVLGPIGGAIGGWLAERATGSAGAPQAAARGRSRSQQSGFWLAVIAAYSVFLMIGFWFPFEISTDGEFVRPRLDGLFRVPFYALYTGSELNAVSQMLVRVLLFVPLGALWGHVAGLTRAAYARRLLWLVGLGFSGALAAGIELLQVMMPSKTADSTEVALCIAGAVAGLYIVTSLSDARDREVSAGV
jgi:glycopeptide antibiotics resistance protein